MPTHHIDISIDVESDFDTRSERDTAVSGVSLESDNDHYPTTELGEQIGLAISKCEAPRKALVLAHAILTEADLCCVRSPEGRVTDAEELLVTAAQEVVDAWEEFDFYRENPHEVEDEEEKTIEVTYDIVLAPGSTIVVNGVDYELLGCTC